MEFFSNLTSESKRLLSDILDKIDIDSTNILQLRILKRKFTESLKEKEKISSEKEKEIADISKIALSTKISDKRLESIAGMDEKEKNKMEKGLEDLLESGGLKELVMNVYRNIVKANTNTKASESKPKDS